MTRLVTIPDLSPDYVLGLLGNLWSRTYGGAQQLRTLCRATLDLTSQHYLSLLEAVACASRFDIPLYHTENWVPVTLQSLTDGRDWPLPPDLVSVPMLMNRVTDPSAVLHEGQDYTCKNGMFQFKQSPYKNKLWTQQPMMQNGQIVGTELYMWGFKGQFDYEYARKHFGDVIGLQASTSEGYKATINAIMNAMVRGTTLADLNVLLALMCGVPLVREPIERVQTLSEDRRGPFVATDLHVYRLPCEPRMDLTEGQMVYAGDPLTDAYEIRELWRPQALTGVQKLGLPVGLLAGGTDDTVWIANNPGAGFGKQLEQGISVNEARLKTSLADYLLPDTNPAQFLVDNVLHSCIMLIVRYGTVDQQLLRRLIPPGVGLIFGR